MHKELRTHLENVTAAFGITDQNQLLFCDQPVSIDTTTYQSQPHQAFHEAVVNTLYQHTHCQKFGEHRFTPTGDPADNRDLSTMLSRANPCQSRWDGGWKIDSMNAGGTFTASRGQEHCELNTGEFILDDPYSGALNVGSSIRIFRPHESITLQPGVYFTFSTNQSLSLKENSQLVRFYFNVNLAGAPDMVEKVTCIFDRFQVPFRFKIMSQSQFFYRVDTAVLYVPAEFYQISVALLCDIYPSVQQHLGSEVSQFTKLLLPGLSFAEDPGDGQSFGMSRCGVMAEAVLAILARGNSTPDERVAEVKRAFARHGIDLNTPYLNPGSVDCYEFSATQHLEAA